MIRPILCYGAEIWGFQYYDKIESVQRKWCRRLLGVPQNTTKEAVVGECGRLPVFVFTLKRCILFWLKLLELPPSRIPRQAYCMLYNFDMLGRFNWASEIKRILFSYGFGYVWLAQEVGNREIFISEFVLRVSDVCRQQWKSNVNEKPKLRVYAEFKACSSQKNTCF